MSLIERAIAHKSIIDQERSAERERHFANAKATRLSRIRARLAATTLIPEKDLPEIEMHEGPPAYGSPTWTGSVTIEDLFITIDVSNNVFLHNNDTGKKVLFDNLYGLATAIETLGLATTTRTTHHNWTDG